MAISKITLNGVTQMDVTSKTVTPGTMLSGTTALKNDGTDIIGNITSKSSSDLTVSGATVTAPAGYYGSAATKSVASGTAGTPTATKGTVSNHAISVTPSVTNTTGYIEGGTKMGTAVSVSASELVSGTKSITSSGTTDVTNYASASVAAGSATTPATTVTANPSISVSSGGLITATASATKSVTPTVSAGFVSSGTAGNITVSGNNTYQLPVITLPISASETATSGYTQQAVIDAGESDSYINIPPGFNETGAYYKISPINYESVYITDGVGGDYAGVTIVKESANSFAMYGTATATRRLLILNGQNSLAVMSTAFSQTIDSGFYIAETSISGYYADAINWRYTYSTFADSVTLCSRSKPQNRVYLENPAMIGLVLVSGANYGTSNNPTYMTISVKKWRGT